MTGGAPIRLTAIVTCRNAEATLARCLDHLAWHGARIVIIDNGSTDTTREIARRFLGGAVVDLREDPFAGAFDLTHQLRLKRDVIRSIGSGWIIHADADEFLDTPDRQPLCDFLRFWDKSGVVAFPCDEIMFLPRTETDCHDPATFEKTMQSCARIREHDPKQRVFRASSVLDRWMATGGHTITCPGPTLAPAFLRLRHYFGLSLDQIRAEYYSRVYAPGDLAKLWHSTRRMSAMRVTAPDPELLKTPDELGDAVGVSQVPVFMPCNMPGARFDAKSEVGPADLILSIAHTKTQKAVLSILRRSIPGIRVGFDASEENATVPRLAVFEHPAAHVRNTSATLAEHAENWVRYYARTRQQGLVDPASYAEVRYEDTVDRPEDLTSMVQGLLSGKKREVSLLNTFPVRKHAGFSGRLAKITELLARDLGYG